MEEEEKVKVWEGGVGKGFMHFGKWLEYGFCFRDSGLALWALHDTYQNFLKMTEQKDVIREKRTYNLFSI